MNKNTGTQACMLRKIYFRNKPRRKQEILNIHHSEKAANRQTICSSMFLSYWTPFAESHINQSNFDDKL